MNPLSRLIPVLLLCASFTAVAVPSIVDSGTTRYSIALHGGASPSEHKAAEELQAYVGLCTGVTLPIVEADRVGEAPLIVLGCGPLAQSLGVDPSPDTLGEQGYALKTVAPHLVVAGTAAAGTLYGVYDLIESTLGVRWFAPGVTQHPQMDTWTLPELDTVVKPAFQWRHTSYAWPDKDDAFLARMRDNQGGGDAGHPFGVQHHHDGRCHSYFWYVSPGEYFEQRPEYFSEIGGVRRSHETQLCLTNPEVLDIVTEKMLQRMAERPGARQHNFSQMDYYNYCQCAACTAVNERLGTMGGTQYWFLNQLAERTARVYPDKLIGTLAYMYTEEPPRDFEMHPNVAVWLCHMFPSCDSHPIAQCPLDADYRRRAKAWADITSHLYIWHYVVNFAHYYNPFPNFRALAADLRFYRDIGVEGIYLQGMGHGGGGGEWSLLRPWYIMQLAWNPDRDADALLREFLQGYYGDAWEPLHQYITLLEDTVANEDIHIHLYTNPAMGYLTDAILDKADALFDDAEARAAGDETLLEAVRVARMPIWYARLFPRNGYRIENGYLHFNGPLASLDAVSAFIQRMQRHGFQTIREMHGDPEQLTLLGLMFSLPIDTPRISNGALHVDMVPLLGGRALRVIDVATDECVMGYDISRSLFFPFCGGEETRIGGMFDPEGMFFQYGVSEHTERSLTMMADTGAWLITRTLTLDEHAPVLRVSVEVENRGDRRRETIVRTHTNLDLGPLETVRVRFENRAGDTVDRDMTPVIAGLREGDQYHDANAPRSEWRLTGEKRVGVIQRFDNAQVDYAWLCAYPDYINDLEAEVWAKPVFLEHGESTRFEYEFEVRPLSEK